MNALNFSKLPLILPRNKHSISRKNIDKNALKVLYRLHRKGFRAYLVGGGVRDLMQGRRPKDFDIVTDARPNKVRKLFRNSFLIGRRFRLVHVKFKTIIIEVSTFRRLAIQDKNQSPHRLGSENTFGTPTEDAYRRDFTINALFYSIADFSLIDHTGGIEDMKAGILRCIGSPEVRFIEDPVRMIRAVRVSARLNFAIDKKTGEGIKDNYNLVMSTPASRLLEEILVLLKLGAARDSFVLLKKYNLLNAIFPELNQLLNDVVEIKKDLFFNYFSALDLLTYKKGEQSPVVLWGTFFLAFFHFSYPELDNFLQDKEKTEKTFSKVIDYMKIIGARLSVPKKQRAVIKLILANFPILLKTNIKHRQIKKIKNKNYISEMLLLLSLYCQVSKDKLPIKQWRRYLKNS